MAYWEIFSCKRFCAVKFRGISSFFYKAPTSLMSGLGCPHADIITKREFYKSINYLY